jgi:hypothetical protein
MSYKIIVTSMGKSVIDKSSKNENGLSFKEAAEKFLNVCEDLKIDFDPDNITNDGNYNAGGVGHDYRIELEEEPA